MPCVRDRMPTSSPIGAPLAPRTRFESLAIAAALAYLAIRLAYLAANVDPALPPDELTHAETARHQLGTFGLPTDDETSHSLGLLAHRPYLYGWLLARWLALHPAALVSDLVWMRLANAAMAFGTVLAGLAFARRAGASPGARVVFVVVLTNLPMWSFLSASVNYDNLAMLLATLALALFARWIDERDPLDALRLAAVACAGALTKAAFLPLAVLIGAASLIADRATALREAVVAFAHPRRLGVRALGIAVGASALASLAVALYGGNLLRFGVLEPAANQVLPLEAALRNRIFRQEHVLRSFRAGAIDFRQAAREIESIEHAGDRAGAMWMLRRALELRRGEGAPLVGRVRYAGIWLSHMGERLFGVMGHRELYKSGPLALAYLGVAIFAFAALATSFRRVTRLVKIGAVISIVYAIFLMQVVNYPIYRTTGLEVEAIQGRYLFPVLVPLIVSLIEGARARLPASARCPVGVAVAALFVLGDFPYFLLRAPAEWYGSP